MRHLSIRAKIFSVILLFAVSFFAYIGVVWVTTKARLEDSDYAHVSNLQNFDADIMPPALFQTEAYTAALEVALRPGDAATVKRMEEVLRGLRSTYQQRRDFWQKNLDEDLATPLAAGAQQTSQQLFDMIEKELVPASKAYDKKVPASVAAFSTVVGKVRELYAQHRAQIEDLVKRTDTEVARHTAEAATIVQTRKYELMGFGVVVVFVSALIGFFIARGISRRLAQTAAVLDGVARGDFTRRIEVHSRDEIGRMSMNLNRALTAVDSAFGEVRNVSARMATAAKSLAASSEEIAAGAQQQAASLEETAASLEEITATVKLSAGNAQQASQLATGSRETAETGGAIVSDAVRAMDEVSKASRRIEDIITTIDEIALQTNLLALNAAVEAARAGEQGRGFAVVAAEVGNLAQRSATAAKEVKTLISDALQRVESGNELVGQSGKALSEIITSVKKVTDIFGEIAAAAREQSAGVDQVNEAVAQMDRVTQANSAQTSALSRTAEGLSQQAVQLDSLVARFQLTSSAGTAAAVTPPPAYPTAPLLPAAGSVPADPLVGQRAGSVSDVPATSSARSEDMFEVL